MTIRWLLVTLLAAGMLLGCLGQVPAADLVPRITPAELQAELGSADLVIIDVRRAADWESSDGKIPGAAREDGASPEKWSGKYPRTQKLVLYCA
ncbi:hypothetical protein DESUT3_13040 [Desulfuromonas versatilis]|uniref:Rhodanese domain-containing protein n=2 Tax=Desulfuromonas versatilis TaxID=2802975 RepID=A0ABN6DVQ2_9BACT|nr:hypothetical protein DESUT3_13040 [Desulfuromonas versatilis]